MTKLTMFGRYGPGIPEMTGLDAMGVKFEAQATINELEGLARTLEHQIEFIQGVENFICGGVSRDVSEVVLRWGANRVWEIIERLARVSTEYDLRRAQAEVWSASDDFWRAYEWHLHPAGSVARH